MPIVDFEQAKLMHERGQIDAALAAYTELLNTDYENYELLIRIAGAQFQKEHYGLAVNVLLSAVNADPSQPAGFLNLGCAFRLLGNYDYAESAFKQGIAVAERGNETEMAAQLHASLGGLYTNNGTPHRALEHLARAVKLAPDVEQFQFNQCFGYLEQYLWRQGFRLYEGGFRTGDRKYRSYKGVPEWDGGIGETLIVWGEQGIGDEIMFASCLADAIKCSKKVIFDCHPRLVETFKRSFGIECHGTRKNEVNVDWLADSGATASVCLSSLATYFRHESKDFPGTPYLKAPTLMPWKCEGWRESDSFKRPRVGISWKGGTALTRADVRSIDLAELKPILSQDFDFYSLQYHEGSAAELAAFEGETGIHIKHYPQWVEAKDYDKTIEFISSLDLVITVCTSAYHAAGALGVPVWCLVPSKPAWRYGTQGDKSPWYRSATLFRQKPHTSWAPVIAEVAQALAIMTHIGEQPQPQLKMA